MDERGNISLPSDIGATAMTEWEICELFGVIAPTVRAGIKALCKHNTPKEEIIMLFDSRTVYLGASRDKYEQYCKALDSEKIKYKTKRVNHEEKMTAPGRGTVRSMGGNFGTDKTLYEIMVGEKDYDNAMGILTALK